MFGLLQHQARPAAGLFLQSCRSVDILLKRDLERMSCEEAVVEEWSRLRLRPGLLGYHLSQHTSLDQWELQSLKKRSHAKRLVKHVTGIK